jgi:hypothetical protein
MDALTKGEEAFFENRANPYTEGSRNYKEWERGFNKSYFSNLEKVKQREQETSRRS